MELIPAIDLRGGHCVRLLRGEYDQETRYDRDPVALARLYSEQGAARLHVVDLDGARTGQPEHLQLLQAMANSADLKVQMGGGIRSEAMLTEVLTVAQRAVIGSVTVDSPDMARQWLSKFGGDRLVFALDVRIDENGIPRITSHGWTESAAISLWDALAAFVPAGLKHVLCTDVSRDGALAGPNIELYGRFVSDWPQVQLQASGGVRDANDLHALAGVGVAAAISGKALLDGLLKPEEIPEFLPNA
jgi:phosphoribosylformimino-5-aminoimidazole carboxamide ribotide isomerase